jgi:DNA-directed RNA polymerase subunit E'/Rpb7
MVHTLPPPVCAMQLIPEEYEYSSANGDAFVSMDATSSLKEGSEVRVRIMGVRTDMSDMVSQSGSRKWTSWE